jgi:ubiquitin C-terminal hydrolase
MNAALQCLSSTASLTDFLLNKNIEAMLNYDNALGSPGGMLAIEFKRVVSELWWSSAPYYSPWGFKKAIGTFAPAFRGLEQ